MLEILQEIYSEISGDYDTVLSPKTKIDTDLKLSSFGKVQLICKIEEKFDIELSAKDARKLKTVNDFIKYIEKNK